MKAENLAARPDPSRDQHLMTNQGTVGRMVSAAGLTRRDVVLEIGAGSGILTKALAKSGAKVIAVEMDRAFAKTLGKIGADNVEIIYANALDVIDKIEFNKIVSNIPYSICEPLMGKLFGRKFDIAVLSAPENFYKIITSNPREKNHSVLSLKAQSFFRVSLLFKIKKEDFTPPPRTESVAVAIRPLSKEEYEKRPEKFLLREIFMQKDKKLKNSLREALIELNRQMFCRHFTKNMARAEIKKMKLARRLLEKKAGEMRSGDFEALGKKLRPCP